jgi:hypothetical protein
MGQGRERGGSHDACPAAARDSDTLPRLTGRTDSQQCLFTCGRQTVVACLDGYKHCAQATATIADDTSCGVACVRATSTRSHPLS